MNTSRLIILQDYLRPGGTESHAVWLADAIREKGVESELLTFRPGGPLAERAGRVGVSLKSLQSVDRGVDWYAPGLQRVLRSAAPDTVLLMGRVANAYAPLVRRALPGVRLVGSVRTGRALPWLVRRALPGCDAVVCNSHSIASTLPACGVEASRVSVIPNPPVLPPMAADAEVRSTMRASWRVSESDVVALCVAGFRPGKGQLALIRAMASAGLVAPVLVLAGDGETRLACEAEAVRCGVADRVRFLGQVSDPRPAYLAADFAVLASEAEALPNFLVEAQLHGLPVVARDVGGVKETFSDGHSGVLVAGAEVSAMIEAWRPLAESAPLRQAMGAHAREWAAARFSKSAALDAYCRVFEF